MNVDQMSKHELQTLVMKLAWNSRFDCYTRNGFEHWIWPEIAPKARFIIFFDMDYLFALNSFFGSQVPVDAKIKQVLSILRRTDYACGQWKSGDEFLVTLIESDERQVLDPEGVKERLVEALKKEGMSATFVIVEVKSWNLEENVQPAEERMYELKKARGVTR